MMYVWGGPPPNPSNRAHCVSLVCSALLPSPLAVMNSLILHVVQSTLSSQRSALRHQVHNR